MLIGIGLRGLRLLDYGEVTCIRGEKSFLLFLAWHMLADTVCARGNRTYCHETVQ